MIGKIHKILRNYVAVPAKHVPLTLSGFYPATLPDDWNKEKERDNNETVHNFCTDEGQMDAYGYCTDKATALGNLILSMHHTVQMLEPEKYGMNQLDIETGNINYFPGGISFMMTVREKSSWHGLHDLMGYVIEVEEIKPGEEEE